MIKNLSRTHRYFWLACITIFVLLIVTNSLQSNVYASHEIEGSTTASAAAPIIEVAQVAGVSDYEIGIFGANFGSNAGSVTILGANATVVEWQNNFVRIVVPTVADGTDSAGLRLTTAAGSTTTSPFTVYTIDPTWLRTPETTYVNVSHGKPVQLQGVAQSDSQCTNYVTGQQMTPQEYMVGYFCRYDIGAKFSADSSLNTEASITLDFEQPLNAGRHLVQFFSRSDWSAAVPDNCPGTGYPADYFIEVSADNNNFSQLLSVTDNLRGNLSHQVDVPAGMRYLRLRVTDSVADCLSSIPGKDFQMKEVTVFEIVGEAGAAGDAIAVYGDSLTAGALNRYVGARNISAAVTSYPSNLPLAPLGFAGFKAVDLAQDFDNPNELSDAFSGDAIASTALYWGIGLGTNDMNLSSIDDDGYRNPNSHLNQFEASLEADAIQWLINQNRVPIIARLPDTDESMGGFGFLEAKIKLLHEIDMLSAEYRLIPGPDLYTEYRLNIERENGLWISGDGTHFTDEGREQWVQMWADTINLARSTHTVTPSPTPSPTPTPPVPQPTLMPPGPYRQYLPALTR